MLAPSATVLVTGSDFLIKEGIAALIAALPHCQLAEPKSHAPFEDLMSVKPTLWIHTYDRSSPVLLQQIDKLKNTDTHVLLIAGAIEKESIQKMITAGVKAIVTKQCSEEEITTAINATIKGDTFICSTILNALFAQDNSTIPLTPTQKDQLLSTREKEVLTLMTQSYTTSAIAEALHLSVHTINSHRKNMLRKLKLKSPVELIVFAMENGLIDNN